MGALYVALNHDRKEAFMLGKSLCNVPVNASLAELENHFDFYDDDYYRDLARRLHEFGVQGIDSDCGSLFELYEDYRYVDSAFEAYRDYVGSYVIYEEDWQNSPTRKNDCGKIGVAVAFKGALGKLSDMLIHTGKLK